jgi:hypothetical protein
MADLSHQPVHQKSLQIPLTALSIPGAVLLTADRRYFARAQHLDIKMMRQVCIK